MKMERIVKRFYDELKDGKIMGRRCPKCSAVEFPPRIACTECGHFEMDWIEMSGNAEVTAIVMPSLLTGPQTAVYQPFAMGCIITAEGSELNAVIRGITPEMEEDVKKKLPLPVKANIYNHEDYSVVVYDLLTD